MRQPGVLTIVADHGPGVGAGHLGRQLALAQAWVAAGGAVAMEGVEDLPGGWAGRYATAGVRSPASGASPPDIVSVDGYRFEPADVAEFRAHSRVLVVDDAGCARAHDADWILDQNLGADPAVYERLAPGVPTLLGPSYALIRQEVVAARPPAADRSIAPQRLVVGLGGDPTAELAALAEAALTRITAQLDVEVVRLAGVADVGPVLADADVALCTAGSTTWELLCFGIPSVLLSVAANQAGIARRVGLAGAAEDAGDLGSVTADQLAEAVVDLAADGERRQRMADEGRWLVDGQGARRVVEALLA